MERKGVLIFIFGFMAVAIIIGGIFIVSQINRFLKAEEWTIHDNLTEEEKNELANMVLMPEIKDGIERYKIRSAVKHSIIVAEMYPQKSKEDLISFLPTGCKEAVESALNGQKPGEDYGTDYDISGNPVYSYSFDSKKLPLKGLSDLDPSYRDRAEECFNKQYSVFKYDDGSYRMVFWFQRAK